MCPIHIYRPQRTELEDLEAILVAREPLLQEMLESLERWKPGASRQHYLLIGPRGIGKTYMLRMIEHRILDAPALKAKWLPIPLAEEVYSITRVSDLLLEALRILSGEIEDKDIIDIYKELKYEDDDQKVIDRSLDVFRKFHKDTGKGILLMMENINRIFERQMKEKIEVHTLRKIAIEEEWLTLIFTSPTYLSAVSEPEEPFFEFFSVKPLAELTRDEQLDMLEKLCVLNKDKAFEDYFRKYKNRIKALYHFTGGNPRLTVMFYDLVVNNAYGAVRKELDLLLDQITPFYQDRMKDISEQEGKVLETMALLYEGCTPTELAKEARMPAKTVRALLTRLKRAGYIRHEQRKNKKTIYIIPERLFRIWHQMNHSRQARGLILYLLEFFSTWYATVKERDEVWSDLTEKVHVGFKNGEGERVGELLEVMKYIAAISKGEEKFKREFARLEQLINTSGVDSAMRELDELDKEYHDDGFFFHRKGLFLMSLGHVENALTALQRATELKKDDPMLILAYAVLLDINDNYDEAKQIYNNGVALIAQKAQVNESEIDDYLFNLSQEADTAPEKLLSILILHKTTKSEVIQRKCINEFVKILNDEDENSRAAALVFMGLSRSEKTIEHVVKNLFDENEIIINNAIFALSKYGSVQALPYLIGSLDKEEVKFETKVGILAASIGIVSRQPDQEIENVINMVITRKDIQLKQRQLFLFAVLVNAFASGKLDRIPILIKSAKKTIEDFKLRFLVFQLAFDYIKSEKNPEILKRQQPEIREAVQKLVDTYDEDRSLASRDKTPNDI